MRHAVTAVALIRRMLGDVSACGRHAASQMTFMNVARILWPFLFVCAHAETSPAMLTSRSWTKPGAEESPWTLLDANPLEDIRNTQKIRALVADGRLYRRADLDRLLTDSSAIGDTSQ